MENLKHTKGEWFNTSDGEANFYGVATKENWLLRIQQNSELLIEEQEANAKLIAAAPDLLEALIDIRNWYENNQSKLSDVTPVCFSKGLSAILKATK